MHVESNSTEFLLTDAPLWIAISLTTEAGNRRIEETAVEHENFFVGVFRVSVHTRKFHYPRGSYHAGQ